MAFTTDSRAHVYAARSQFVVDSRPHSYRSYLEMTTDSRVHRYAARSQFVTDSRPFQYSDKAFITGSRVHRFSTIQQFTTDSRVFNYVVDSQEWADIQRGIYIFLPRAEQPKPVVSLSSSSGNVSTLCPRAIVVSQRENSSLSLNVAFKDKHYRFHPYGTGVHNDKLDHSAELDVSVSWGGHTEVFSAVMKRPVIQRSGQSEPEITWAGNGHANKLWRAKRTLESLGAIGRPTGVTNITVLTEVCDAVGLKHRWKGINKARVGGPYHRQQLKPGEIAKQMLDLVLDNWREEGRYIVGYDPEKTGRHWRYTLGEDIVFEHTIQPEDNEEYDKIVVLRAIAGGKLQATGLASAETAVDAFGEYTVNFSPPLSSVLTKIDYADYRGAFSDFRYPTQSGIVYRQVRGNWPSTGGFAGAIINAPSVTFTWGAKTPEVTNAGVTAAKGGISFFGVPYRAGTTGTGDEEIGPTDMTTRVFAGDINGVEVLEMSPTPLLYNAAAMQFLANKALRLLGKPWIEHTYRIPLNHRIKCGDRVTVKKDLKLGGGFFAPMEVIAWQHNISGTAFNNFTLITLRERLTS